MINYKDTILCAIKDSIDKMRFLGDYNPKLLKKILYLIMLDDLGEWSDYLDERLPVLNKIKEIKECFLLNNPELKVKKLINDRLYTNVNSPQTNDTWKRVWDSQRAIMIKDNIEPFVPGTTPPASYTPDPKCPIEIVYFDSAGKEGKPLINIESLTICEKMNIYINRETGLMFYLDPDTCTWKPMRATSDQIVKWTNIVGKPTIYLGIKHDLYPTEGKFRVLLQEEGDTSDDVAITSENDSIDDVL